MDDSNVYVANGEQGEVKAVFSRYMIVELQNPTRLVRLPFGKTEEDGTEAGCCWDLAYAISVHRALGSEWPIVIVMLDSYPGAVRLVDRHWIYTAISRAREMCICIGKASIAEKAVLRSAMWKRKTFLRELIGSLADTNLATGWESDLLEAVR